MDKLKNLNPSVLDGFKKIRKIKNANNISCINEYGLYELLATSKLKNAIVTTFKQTLYEDILPQLRKTGNYISNTETINETINSKSKQKQLQHLKNHSSDVMGALKNINIQHVYQNETDIKNTNNKSNKSILKKVPDIYNNICI
jgi:prophage antirepressor-like protein